MDVYGTSDHQGALTLDGFCGKNMLNLQKYNKIEAQNLRRDQLIEEGRLFQAR
jgi:hypothetical protein